MRFSANVSIFAIRFTYSMFEDNRLRIFLTLAGTGSFTGAARELGITQPAVSQNIAELEKEMGAPLFIRTRSGVTLSEKGVLFKEYAEKIQHWYRETQDLFSPGRSGPRKVRIAISGELQELLPDRVASRILAGDDDTAYIILPYGSKPADIEIWQEDGAVHARATAEFAHSHIFRKILDSIL